MESNTIKTVFVLTLLLTTYVFSSCSRNPYAATNKSYRKQADHYADILEKYPLEDSNSNAPHFVGTTNFNMRKPNFVIIHHTAQNSCDQTLKPSHSPAHR